MKAWTLFGVIYSAAFAVFGLVCIAIGNGNILMHALCVIGQIVIGTLNARRYLKLRAQSADPQHA